MIFHNAYLIYNPVAGRMIRKPHRLPQALAALRQAGHTVSEHPTSGPHDASEIARQAVAEGADLVLAAGGDGTINEVINGMVGSNVPLAVLPGGTANVLCCEIGLGTNMRVAAQKFSELVPLRIALGRFHRPGQDDRYFALMAGVGLDAAIVENMDSDFKRRWGKAAYWFGGFGAVMRRLPEMRAVVDGDPYQVSFALATRVRNYGGDLEIARQVRLYDPNFEVVLFEGRWAVRYLKYFAGIFLNNLSSMSGVTVRRAHRVDFEVLEADPVFSQLDGEAAGRIPASLEIVPDALTLMIPPGYANGRHG